jgi:GTP-binding protein HflX
VVDVSSPEALKQIDSVNKVLAEIGCKEKQILLVLNKIDVLSDVTTLELLQTLHRDAICISAKTGYGLDRLHDAVVKKYKGSVLHIKLTISPADGKIQSFLRAYGVIINEQYSDGQVLIEAQLGQNQLVDLKRLRPESLEIIDGGQS